MARVTVRVPTRLGETTRVEGPAARRDAVQLETLCHMFFDGPVWDGNLVSKTARDRLVDAGLADRAEGYNFITARGVRLAAEMGFTDRKTGRHPLATSEWRAYRSSSGIED